MERETKKIKTPTGVEVELHTYVTGREKRRLRSVFLNDAEVTSEGNNIKTSGIKGSLIDEAENAAIEIVVVSVNGSKENKVEAILNLPSNDYDVVMKAINEITNDTDFLGQSKN